MIDRAGLTVDTLERAWKRAFEAPTATALSCILGIMFPPITETWGAAMLSFLLRSSYVHVQFNN